jgi:hypothetical protein
MSDITLGRLIEGQATRDAIHVAVVPVRAGHAMRCGDAVTVYDGEAFLASPDKAVGVIDPFLTDVVAKGDRVWLLLKPGTTTNLRHSWTHPSFPDEDGIPQDDDGYNECRGC